MESTIDKIHTGTRRASHAGLLALEATSDRDWGIHPLSPGRVTIGTAAECDIVLNASGVAGRHCQILVGPAGAIMKSWDKRTWVNDIPLAETMLTVGDRLTIGPITLVVRRSLVKPAAKPIPSSKPPLQTDPVPTDNTSLRDTAATDSQTVDRMLQELQRQAESVKANTAPAGNAKSPFETDAIFERLGTGEPPAPSLDAPRHDGDSRNIDHQDASSALEHREEKIARLESELAQLAIRLDRDVARINLQESNLLGREVELAERQAAADRSSRELAERAREHERQLLDFAERQRAHDKRLRQWEQEHAESAEQQSHERQQLTASRDELAARQAELDSLASELNRRQAEIANAEEEATSRLQKITADAAALEEQRRHVEQTEASLHALQEKLDRREHELNVGLEQLTDERSEHERLSAELKALQEQLSERDAVLTDREQELSSRTTAIERRIEEADAVEQRLSERESALAARHAGAVELEQQIQQMRERNEREKAELESAARQLNARQTEIDALQTENSGRASELEQQQEALTARIDRAEQREARLTAREAELDAKSGELESRAALASERIEQLEQRERDVTARHEELANREAALTAREEDLAAREQDFGDAAAERNLLQEQLSNARDRQAELSDELSLRSAESLTCQSQAAQRDEEVAELHTRLESLRTELKDITTGRDEISAALDTRNAEFEPLQQQLVDRDAERDAFREELAAANEKLAASESQAEQHTHEVAELRAELGSLRSEREEATGQQEPVTVSNEKRIADLETLEQQVAERAAERDAVREELNTAREQLVAAQARTDQQSEEFSELQEELDSLRAKSEAAAVERDSLADGLAAKEAIITELRQDASNAESENGDAEALSRERDTWTQEKSTHEAELAALREDLARTTERQAELEEAVATRDQKLAELEPTAERDAADHDADHDLEREPPGKALAAATDAADVLTHDLKSREEELEDLRANLSRIDLNSVENAPRPEDGGTVAENAGDVSKNAVTGPDDTEDRFGAEECEQSKEEAEFEALRRELAAAKAKHEQQAGQAPGAATESASRIESPSAFASEGLLDNPPIDGVDVGPAASSAEQDELPQDAKVVDNGERTVPESTDLNEDDTAPSAEETATTGEFDQSFAEMQARPSADDIADRSGIDDEASNAADETGIIDAAVNTKGADDDKDATRREDQPFLKGMDRNPVEERNTPSESVLDDDDDEPASESADSLTDLRQRLAQMFDLPEDLATSPTRRFDDEAPVATEPDSDIVREFFEGREDRLKEEDDDDVAAEEVDDTALMDVLDTAPDETDYINPDDAVAKPGEEPDAETDADDPDSIESYMERLLARNRKGNAAPSLSAPKVKQSTPRPTAPTAELTNPSRKDKTPEVDATVVTPQEDRLARPRTPINKDDVRADLKSFREIANLSAQTAIQRHSTSRTRKIIIARSFTAGLSTAITAGLAISPWLIGKTFTLGTVLSGMVSLVSYGTLLHAMFGNQLSSGRLAQLKFARGRLRNDVPSTNEDASTDEAPSAKEPA